MKGIAFFVLLLFFAGWAIAVLRKPKSSGIVRSYIAFLYFWAIVFVAIAISASSGSKHAVEIIKDNCNSTGLLHLVDLAYTTANTQLCGLTCPCYANSTRWADRSAN